MPRKNNIGDYDIQVREEPKESLEQVGENLLLHLKAGSTVSLGNAEEIRNAAEKSGNPTKFLEEKIIDTKKMAAENWGHRKK